MVEGEEQVVALVDGQRQAQLHLAAPAGRRLVVQHRRQLAGRVAAALARTCVETLQNGRRISSKGELGIELSSLFAYWYFRVRRLPTSLGTTKSYVLSK